MTTFYEDYGDENIATTGTAAQLAQYKEDIFIKLANVLITKFDDIKQIAVDMNGQPIETLAQLQKSIQGGAVGYHGADDRIVMYQYDRKANLESDTWLIDTLVGLDVAIDTLDIVFIYTENNASMYAVISGNGDQSAFNQYDIVEEGIQGAFTIPLESPDQTLRLIDNLSQFVSFTQSRPVIDPIKAKEILDTTIYELLPGFQTRQEEIDAFFAQYEKLVNPTPPDFDKPDTDPYWEEYNAEEIGTSPDDPNAWITRVGGEKTLEYLRDDLKDYFGATGVSAEDMIDMRPRYVPKSSGYLQIRNLNQAIIIRNMESDDVGLGTKDNPIWQNTGFTITMWVKFLDKVGGGTLFNLGNPLRTTDPYGFMLETYVVNKTETSYITPGYWETEPGAESIPIWGFDNSDTERFIRLVVRDEYDDIRDSHMPIPAEEMPDEFNNGEALTRQNTTAAGQDPYGYPSRTALDIGRGMAWTHTRVPVDLQEWYFIVATYDPDYLEDESHGINVSNRDFWKWNVVSDGSILTDPLEYTAGSNYGNKCKVEIISKTDLLRARGYRL